MQNAIRAYMKELAERAPPVGDRKLADILKQANKLPREYDLGPNMVLSHYFEEGNKRYYLVQINGSGTAPIKVTRENGRVIVDLTRIPRLMDEKPVSKLIGGLGIAKECAAGKVEFKVLHAQRLSIPKHLKHPATKVLHEPLPPARPRRV